MAAYLSDTDRTSTYTLAMKYIRQAHALNAKVSRLRSMYEQSGESFGGYGSVLDDILADAAVLDAKAQSLLSGIDDNAQPVIWAARGDCTYIGFSTGSPGQFNFVGLSDTTDLPSSGTIIISNASDDSNNGTYTVTGRTGSQVNVSGPTVADHDYTAVVTWLSY